MTFQNDPMLCDSILLPDEDLPMCLSSPDPFLLTNTPQEDENEDEDLPELTGFQQLVGHPTKTCGSMF